MEEIYIVIDESDSYHTMVREFKSKEAMLKDIERRDIDDLKAFKATRLKLTKVTSIEAE